MPISYDYRGKEIYISFVFYQKGIITQRLDHQLKVAGSPFHGALTAQLLRRNELITYDWSAPKWMKDLGLAKGMLDRPLFVLSIR